MFVLLKFNTRTYNITLFKVLFNVRYNINDTAVDSLRLNLLFQLPILVCDSIYTNPCLIHKNNIINSTC